MHKWVSVLLVSLALSGCSGAVEDVLDETPESSDDSLGEGALETLSIAVSFSDFNFTLGQTINVTLGQALNFTLASPANATIAWDATLVPDAVNMTANETANATASAMGAGLPVNVSLVPTLAGNHTLTIVATGDGYENATMTYAVVVIGVVEEVVVDPCAGVPPQEGYSFSGIMLAGAANSGLITTHDFDVAPCNTKITVVLTAEASDPILRMLKPDGTYIEVDSGFVGDAETVEYEPAGGVPAGEYGAQVRPFLSVASPYTVTVTFE